MQARITPIAAYWFGLVAMLSFVGLVQAGQPHTFKGMRFQHHDWELACDNSGTCRAVGYHVETDDLPIAVLLRRAAGPDTRVTAEVKLGWSFNDDAEVDGVVSHLLMRINKQGLGQIVLSAEEEAQLSAHQTQRLLKALRKDSRIVFVGDDGLSRRLSDRGASAVLLKMDEFQGRLHTPGALIRKGRRAEHKVPAAVPLPTLQAAPIQAMTPAGKQWLEQQRPRLRQWLRTTMAEDDYCQSVVEGASELEIEPLSASHVLLSAHCWMAAYNYGRGYWVLELTEGAVPELVTTDASDYDNGTLTAQHKGRGIGDCWSGESWQWDGKSFVLVEQMTTGMCRQFAGGAWSLPTWQVQVLP